MAGLSPSARVRISYLFTTPHFASPLIRGWTRGLFPPIGYCELPGYTHGSADTPESLLSVLGGVDSAVELLDP